MQAAMPERLKFNPEQPEEQNPAEAGLPSFGLPESQAEHQSHAGGVNKPGLHPTQRVWEILEREVMLDTLHSTRMADARSRYSSIPNEAKAEAVRFEQDYLSESRNLVQLLDELEEAGTEREKRILHLFYTTTIEPAASGPRIRQMPPEEFQQFRSQVEALSDEEISKVIHKIEEAHAQQIEEIAAEESNKLPRAIIF
jgi:hypothetical protein